MRLDVAGTDWVIYKDRFMWSIDACGLAEHVDGSKMKPKGSKDRMKPKEQIEAELETEEKWEKEVKPLKQDEAIV